MGTAAHSEPKRGVLRLQTFWTERRLYRTSAQSGHRMKIVLLGFGPPWEALLTGALQYNIFDPRQRIEYYVFGGGRPASLPRLDAISDPVFFRDGPPPPSLLEEAQLVLCLGAADCPRPDALRLPGPRLDPGGRYGVLLERAKRINLRYAHLYRGAPEDAEALEAEWQRLDAFSRGSNLCSAAYHEVRLEMLEGERDLSPERMELLTELEHIRWCRYYLLHNWRLGAPEDGSSRDPVRLLHRDLIPYEELSEAAKEKDRENIRILLSLA